MTSDLKQRVVDHFHVHAGRFGFRDERITAERVLNWGGFGTHSFNLSDGQRRLHLKLAVEQTEMRRWFAVHEWLEREYRAPRILDWVAIAGTSYGGLVFEHINGTTWDLAARPELLHDVLALLRRLHKDDRLADLIGDAPKSYRECWELRYREQFRQDLLTVREVRPASVSDARFNWMEQEARNVLALVAGHSAFADIARAPCHWDLWPDNVLVGGGDRFWVIDWDSLAVGDEAEDFATVVWPFVYRHDIDWRDLIGAEKDSSFLARMELHLQAITLDYVIDVLADWAECDVPEWQEQVRERKEAEHAQYLAWYLSRWG